MAVDADFEHARLLKIHTSVVVSARSVKGVYGMGNRCIHSAPYIRGSGGTFLITILTCNTPRLHYFTSLLSVDIYCRIRYGQHIFSRAGVHNHMQRSIL